MSINNLQTPAQRNADSAARMMYPSKPAPEVVLKHKHDRAPKEVRPKGFKFEKRLRALHEALPPEADLFKRPDYKIGDGDTHAVMRPGSQDFLKYPSKGFAT